MAFVEKCVFGLKLKTLNPFAFKAGFDKFHPYIHNFFRKSQRNRSIAMEIKNINLVSIDKPEAINFILGQSHFIKTVEDIHEALIGAMPGIEFGVAFCEASGPRLVRWSGTDEECLALARKNAQAIGAGHCFIIFLGNAFPINVLTAVKNVPEVCRIFCATANPVQVLVAETAQGRGILGVIDGGAPLGIEGEKEIAERKNMLRKIGYKL